MLPIHEQVTFLDTPDLAASARFYGDVLGLPLALDQGTCRIYKVAGSAYLGLCQRDGDVLTPSGVIVTLVSHDVDGWHEMLRRAGVSIETPPTFNAAYNITHMFLRDPHGVRVEVQQFHDPAWPQA